MDITLIWYSLHVLLRERIIRRVPCCHSQVLRSNNPRLPAFVLRNVGVLVLLMNRLLFKGKATRLTAYLTSHVVEANALTSPHVIALSEAAMNAALFLSLEKHDNHTHFTLIWHLRNTAVIILKSIDKTHFPDHT